MPSEIKVGDWEVDSRRNELRRNGVSLHLEPKVVEVLIHLARHAGSVVGREDLLAAVWPGVVVGDDAVTQAIIKLRKALGDDAHTPTYIETISKRGYRLIAPVGRAAPARRRIRVGVAAACVLGLAAVAVTWHFSSRSKVDVVAVSEAFPTVAVLPLSNLSGDPRREYFSDGMTEDLINALGRFSGLRVMSKNAVQGYKGKEAAPRAIRDKLGARYVVHGSVREAAGKLRVAIELSDTDKGAVLWAERYEGDSKDLFEFQDRVVRNVGAIAAKLSRLEQERTSAKSVNSLEAYDLVLRARALAYLWKRDENRQARALLAKATQLAPDYAEAYVALAEAEYLRAMLGWVQWPHETLATAEAHARRALSIEDTGAHARAHAMLARIYAALGDYDRGIAAADRAIALNPSDVIALYARGEQLVWLGRAEEGVAALERARRYDGGSFAGLGLAFGYFVLGRYSEALDSADSQIARSPEEHRLALAIRAAALGQMGRAEEARRAAAALRGVMVENADQFGTRFRNREHTLKFQDGLRKAGFD